MTDPITDPMPDPVARHGSTMRDGPRFLFALLLLTAAACARSTGQGPAGRVAENAGTVAQPADAGLESGFTIWDGVYSERQAVRGASEYLEACSSCHSADLRGNSNAPSLVGSSFMFLWADRSLGDLFSSIQTLMPTNAPNSLPTQSYLSILAYIMEANAFPAGEREMVADPEVLGRIRITARPGL